MQSLVTRARAGGLDAYGEIVRRFQDMACGYAYSILGDFHLAEDAAQEAFIEAYRCLGNLREPAAFPGWFRRIVFKHCDRLRRRKEVRAMPLDEAGQVRSSVRGPAETAERSEMRNEVLDAIRRLPAGQREATTLFYINGYSQQTIADFLNVPVTTINNRLSASRSRLKERMLNMVEKTLHTNAPDERFNKKVIDKLLGGPRLLEIEGHPIRQILETIKTALPSYQVVQTDDVVDTKAPLDMTQDALDNVCRAGQTYHPTDQTILRTQMSWQTLGTVRGQTPPIRLLLPGRIFSAQGWPGASDIKVGHVCDALCIESGYDMAAAKAILEPVIQAVLGQIEIRMETDPKKAEKDGPIESLITFTIRRGDEWWGVCRGGMLNTRFFQEVGFDPDAVGGSHFGFGLDRLAVAKLGIDDIRKLWAPPYVPE